MYYLNDQHPTKEYALYCRVNNGTPYLTTTFQNLNELNAFLSSVIKRHNKYHYSYYIDGINYPNIYPMEFAQFYYKVLERPINDWQEIA